MTKKLKSKTKSQPIAKRLKLKAFTLLELLLVIAIISALAGIIMFSLNPAERIQKANNTKRKADVDSIKRAINTYGLDNGGVEFDLTLCTNTICEICSTTDSGTCTTAGKLNIGGLIGTQLSSIPLDPRVGSRGVNGTGYFVSKTGEYTKVIALGAELGEVITSDGVTRSGTVASVTFTPNVAKRNSAGPFAAGVMVQTNQNVDPWISDAVYFSHGNNISKNFRNNIDFNQGSIIFWITPEWNGNDGLLHYFLLQASHGYVRLFKNTSNQLVAQLANSSASVDASSWTAGSTYLVVARWDTRNKLNGTNYVSLSVGDSHTFGGTSISDMTSFTPGGFMHFGSYDAASSYRYGANAIIEGLTIYRRPLFDGVYGIDVGNGDEIAQIYNSGNGQDPTLITGSWDVVFALPTNASTGTLATGTGNAWSHPHSSNLLYTSTTNTGGFMLGADAITDGWTNIGSPSSVAALSSNEKIFAGGYKFTSNGDNQGIYRTFTATSGGDYVLRALGHSDGTCNPKIQITRADGTTVITSLIGTTTSTRAAPNIYIFTWESPAAESEQVQLINTASSGTCYWHQVEVLVNLVNNPSFETGSGDPWMPTGWPNASLITGESSQDFVIKNSGLSSFKETVSSYGWADISSNSLLASVDTYYSSGFWTKLTSGASWVSYWYGWGPEYSSGDLYEVYSQSTAKFNHVVLRGYRNDNTRRIGIRTTDSNNVNYDDFYFFQLSPISLTVTSANLTNSTEASGLRIDGKDTYTRSIEKIIDVKGSIEFHVTPRHSFSVADKFGFTKPVIAHLYIDANNSLKLYKENATILRLTGVWNGVSVDGDWSSPTLNAGTKYNMEITYESSTSMKLIVDGVERINIALTGKKFGVTPSGILYLGSDNTGSNQYDMTVDTGTIVFKLI
ncbi:prepilin-type N-terminal cleavage/methylation domain-containing protein [Candidatus Dojkabacteria bacterium]|nr:prepilin-type N-terminal cleavage/methylation domain-containing protein [Candidatus Dojkabacteria bacterium]